MENEQIVVAKLSAINFEARLPWHPEVGIGTSPEEAVAALGELEPRVKGLPYEVRLDPFLEEE